MSRLRPVDVVKAKTVSRNSGTARMSRNSRRVNPTLPAPMKAILMGMTATSSPPDRWGAGRRKNEGHQGTKDTKYGM